MGEWDTLRCENCGFSIPRYIRPCETCPFCGSKMVVEAAFI